MEKIVVLSGAGMSAESGLKTFRDSDGLWENHRIEDVATPEAWFKDPELVLKFYNERRKQVNESEPNNAHSALARLESHYEVDIITQNIDDLHERSGAENVLHLHGKLRESKSVLDHSIYSIKDSDLNLGDLCPQGAQLRPNVVWFGEPVPKMDEAIELVLKADIFIIIGTSLNVYPAASLMNYVRDVERTILIDPLAVSYDGVELLCSKATKAVPKLVYELLND